MTITRIFQDGFEWTYSLSVLPWTGVASMPDVYSAPFTGTSSLRISNPYSGVYFSIPSPISQIRIAANAKIFGVNSTNTPPLFWLGSDRITTLALRLYYTHSTTTWTVAAGATTLGTFVYDPVSLNAGWHHWGIDFLSHASAGWCYVYVDGVAVFSYTGKTDHGAATFNLIGVGPDAVPKWSTLYVDDFYCDESTGEAAPGPLTIKRFFPIRPDGNGNYSQWHGTDGNQVNNYALVNKTPTAAYSTMVAAFLESLTSGHKDSWTLGASGLPSNTIIAAVIPQGIVQTRTVTAGIQARYFLRQASTDAAGATKTPTVDYGWFWHRFALAPDGGAWTPAKVDATEAGIEIV